MGGEDHERRAPFQAVVLADSFNVTFRPFTLERPKALLPLCGVPMLEYTMEFLEAQGVEEAFVFCCAHYDQVIDQLKKKWKLRHKDDEDAPGERYVTGRMKVVPIISTSCVSVGEAMRIIYDEGVVSSDFVLITGDTVASFDLKSALAEHKRRRKADKSAIMTMVVKRAETRALRKRWGDHDLVLQIDPDTKQVLGYEEEPNNKNYVNVDVSSCFLDRSQVEIREDLVDCYVDVCAPEVLGLFQDNFDYQNLRRDFVGGVLSEEELGNKIYAYELSPGVEYAARIHNPRSYDAVSRDVWAHWLFPIEVGQTRAFTSRTHNAGIVRRGIQDCMQDAGVSASRSVEVGNDCQIGEGTTIGDNSKIHASFVGKGCRIGRNVELNCCHLLDGVNVADGARIHFSMLSDGVAVQEGAVVSEGCLLGSGVVVGKDHVVPAFSRVSVIRQTQEDSDSEEELESPAVVEGTAEEAKEGEAWDATLVGEGGKGLPWSAKNSQTRREWRRHSISPHYAQLEAAGMAGALPETSDGEDRSDDSETDETDSEGLELDPEEVFHSEVRETFLRCVKERFDQTNALIELNALKIAEDRTFADCARFIFTTIVGLCFPVAKTVSKEYKDLYASDSLDLADKLHRAKFLKHLKSLLSEWGNLLQRFLKNEDDQVELLLTFEEYCSDDGVFHAENGSMCAEGFCQVLQLLYDSEVISEEAILSWAEEKESAEEEDKVFLEKARPFVAWLAEADEESDEYSSEEEGEDSDED